MSIKPYAKVFTLSAVALALSACNSSDKDSISYANPGMPSGISVTEPIATPALNNSDIAIVDGNIEVTNNKSNVVAYNENVNPILQILSGFNSIWAIGDQTWSSTGSNSLTVADGYETYTGVDGGATNSTSKALLLNFSGEMTLDEEVWHITLIM